MVKLQDRRKERETDRMDVGSEFSTRRGGEVERTILDFGEVERWSCNETRSKSGRRGQQQIGDTCEAQSHEGLEDMQRRRKK